ncbi:S8 family serine peptidase [Micromonosporaceae bacterium B7E4]
MSLAVAFATPSSPAAAAPPPEDGGAATTGSASSSRTVTLITGDRVTVVTEGNGRPHVLVEPAPRSGIASTFHTRSDEDGDIHTVPGDVSRLVPEVLDPALFNVSALIRMGYDDSSRDNLPLIVQSAGQLRTTGTAPGMPLPAVATARDLPSIAAVAAVAAKDRAAELGRALADRVRAQTGAATTAQRDTRVDAVDKIWLDRRVQAAELDGNLTAIAAPAAWESGLTGDGITVAVLDTGIDATHPDLAGQVSGASNFTTSPDGDAHGHGTHVASIVAGTGAVADGSRRGVAFGSRLLAGKVLGDDGSGQLSWVIDGMQWAAESGADVVNLSLNSPAGTDDDPLVQALDQLAETTGTLFVAAAGNSGPGSSTIESPGSAASALTVGAAAASFSSVGPTRGSYRIKPNLLAPGIDIVGARAGGGSGDPYVTGSGTSQATPHVAGAAALLMQQHPEWSWKQIKSALVGSARPSYRTSLWEQGGGQLDLRQAIDQSVVADRDVVDFGVLRHPASEPVSVALTVTNTGTTDRTLSLGYQPAVAGVGPVPEVPAGLITFTPATLPLAAGESATVTVTVDPQLADPALYPGRISLTDGTEVALRLPTAFYREPEVYDLKLQVLNRLGQPHAYGELEVINGESYYSGAPRAVHLDADGRATVRIWPGPYSVMGIIHTPASGHRPESVAIAGSPEIWVTEDRSYVVDARKAQRLAPAEVQGTKTRPTETALSYSRGTSVNWTFHHLAVTPEAVTGGQVYVQPTEPVTRGTFTAEARWRLESTGHVGRKQPEVFDLMFSDPTFAGPPEYQVSRHELDRRMARVENTFNAVAEPGMYAEGRAYHTAAAPVSFIEYHPLRVPQVRYEAITTRADLHWQQCLRMPGDQLVRMCEPGEIVSSGERRFVDWLRGLAPAVLESRQDYGYLQFDVGLTDGRHKGQQSYLDIGSPMLRLRQDGNLIGESARPYGSFPVPDEPGRYQLEYSGTIRDPSLPYGQRTSTTWTFHTRGPSTTPRTLRLDYQPEVDEFGRARAGRDLRFTMWALPDPDGGAAVRPRTARMWISTDGGRSWQETKVSIRRDGMISVVVPGKQLRPWASLSTRVVVTEADGTAIDQTIIDAYPLR